jgi:hypothetical protein
MSANVPPILTAQFATEQSADNPTNQPAKYATKLSANIAAIIAA